MFKAWCEHAYDNQRLRHRIYWNRRLRVWEGDDTKPVEGRTLQWTKEFCFASASEKHDPYEEKP